MILYWGARDSQAAAWCRERGWRYHLRNSIYGCEAKCVVLMNFNRHLYPEYITRGISMLIIFADR